MQVRSSVLAFGLVLVVALGFSGCSNKSLSPFQPEINNAPGSFQFQATQVRNVSTKLTYTWQNAGTVANVNHATTTTAGSARVEIRDPAGTHVYTHDLVPSLAEVTASGTAGAWVIEVVLSNYSGTLNFRVETP